MKKATINYKLRKIRELKNLSQEYIARELDISTRAYSMIETGERPLNTERLEHICEILEIEPYEVYMFDSENVLKNSVAHEQYRFYERLLEEKDKTISILTEQLKLLMNNQEGGVNEYCMQFIANNKISIVAFC
ncbi:helix-turn-helix transcriptional regulator [Salibacter sp.]|uniref:helix-turn-helix domain-containing protein n=1 Tax=Salibacter sp. TaxID=2010995 RepID=UPI0028704961|nr:helix-turn-helix transcriptional regulator [Salibacter sp.]MDR9488104.1 helix-turn-helix transcriptional regulator [Salibacter sp.]